MALDLHLEDDEVDVLAFTLDSAIQQMIADQANDLDNFALDPAYTDLDRLMQACGSLVQMAQTLRGIRAQLTRVG